MTLLQEWSEELGQLNKKDYERVAPLVNALEDEDDAVNHLRKIERDFEELQSDWKHKLQTEDILNKIWRRIEIIQFAYNTKHGYKKTRWEMFEEIAREKNWEPVIEIMDEMIDIESNKDRALTEETVKDLEERYRKILPYIATEIGMGYRGMIMNEFDKRFRFYKKRMERQVKGDFGSWLKSARKEKGYSLKKMEELSGVTASYIHRIEKGARKTPSIPITEKLAIALGVPPRDLLNMLGHSTDDVKEDGIGLTELIALNNFTVDGKMVNQQEKDMIVNILNTMLNEDWDEQDVWTKGADLLKNVARLKRQLKES